MIETALEPVLTKQGYKGLEDMALWMGQPYEPQSPANQQTYLDFEADALHNVFRQLNNGFLRGNSIVDTTGSVVHTNPRLYSQLGALTTVVYLAAASDMQDEMFQKYKKEPKPVIWGDLFEPGENESPNATLERCYPDLLAHRSVRYEAMADITISREVALELAATGASSFLEHIKDASSKAPPVLRSNVINLL